MSVDLSTTNMLLGIMAAVSLLEALLVIGLFAGGVVFYRRISQALASIESNQIAPVSERARAILDDIKAVTGALRSLADRIPWTRTAK